MSLMFVNGLLEIRICFPLCCGFVVSLVWTMGRDRRVWWKRHKEKKRELPPPPPPPEELQELLGEQKKQFEPVIEGRSDSEDDLVRNIQKALPHLTPAQRWLGPEPVSSGDDPVPHCVQVPVPDGGVQDEGKDGDKGKGPDKAPGFCYQ